MAPKPTQPNARPTPGSKTAPRHRGKSAPRLRHAGNRLSLARSAAGLLPVQSLLRVRWPQSHICRTETSRSARRAQRRHRAICPSKREPCPHWQARRGRGPAHRSHDDETLGYPQERAGHHQYGHRELGIPDKIQRYEIGHAARMTAACPKIMPVSRHVHLNKRLPTSAKTGP